jgi:hypothetical protein
MNPSEYNYSARIAPIALTILYMGQLEQKYDYRYTPSQRERRSRLMQAKICGGDGG